MEKQAVLRCSFSETNLQMNRGAFLISDHENSPGARQTESRFWKLYKGSKAEPNKKVEEGIGLLSLRQPMAALAANMTEGSFMKP